MVRCSDPLMCLMKKQLKTSQINKRLRHFNLILSTSFEWKAFSASQLIGEVKGSERLNWTLFGVTDPGWKSQKKNTTLNYVLAKRCGVVLGKGTRWEKQISEERETNRDRCLSHWRRASALFSSPACSVLYKWECELEHIPHTSKLQWTQNPSRCSI